MIYFAENDIDRLIEDDVPAGYNGGSFYDCQVWC